MFSKFHQETVTSANSPEAKKESEDAIKVEIRSLLAGHDDLLSEFESLVS